MENANQQSDQPTHTVHTVIVKSTKSVGVALLLTFFFGPLGMFYSTITGAIVMIVVTIVVLIFTFGFGALVTWPVCMIWGAIAASNYNKKL